MVKPFLRANYRGPVKFCAVVLILLSAVMLWPGCSDDPVTPRKSVIGAWELITLKIDGEEVKFVYDAFMVFHADSTGYTEVCSEGGFIDTEEFESWETKGDSLLITIEGVTRSAWYSCTEDRLVIREYDESEDETLDWIYARVGDL